MKFKSVVQFTKKYFILLGVAICLIFVIFASFYKSYGQKQNFVYVKVKLGQGLWWAQTAKPNIWMTQSIKKGDTQKGFTGQAQAEILSVTYYPVWATDQYDTYLTLKLLVTQQKATHQYLYSRDLLAPGTPIELSFPSLSATGTVMQLSNKPIINNLIEKTITISKRFATPWEYEGISIGDIYNNGENNVFEIIDKQTSDSLYTSLDNLGSSRLISDDLRKNISIKAKIKVSKQSNNYVFGEEQIIRIGKPFNFSTSKFTFSDYSISSIE